jgi:hypothetical protein
VTRALSDPLCPAPLLISGGEMVKPALRLSVAAQQNGTVLFCSRSPGRLP